jgi:hypothetical protein
MAYQTVDRRFVEPSDAKRLVVEVLEVVAS